MSSILGIIDRYYLGIFLRHRSEDSVGLSVVLDPLFPVSHILLFCGLSLCFNEVHSLVVF